MLIKNKQKFFIEYHNNFYNPDYFFYYRGKLVGFTDFCQGYIENFIILPSFRDRGFGTKMMRTLVRKFGRKYEFSLMVRTFNTIALHIFEEQVWDDAISMKRKKVGTIRR